MQYLPQIDINQPISAIAEKALREPVCFADDTGKQLVLMSEAEYRRVAKQQSTQELLAVAKALAVESERNGLTQEIVDQILAEPS